MSVKVPSAEVSCGRIVDNVEAFKRFYRFLASCLVARQPLVEADVVAVPPKDPVVAEVMGDDCVVVDIADLDIRRPGIVRVVNAFKGPVEVNPRAGCNTEGCPQLLFLGTQGPGPAIGTDGRDTGISEAARRNRNHGDQLPNIACLLRDIGCENHLGVFIDDRLGVVGAMEPVIRFHHPGFRVREVALRPPSGCRPRCRRRRSFRNPSVVGAVLLGLASWLVRRLLGGFSLDGLLGGTQLDETALPACKLWEDLVLELFDPRSQTALAHRPMFACRGPQLRTVQSNPTQRDEPCL